MPASNGIIGPSLANFCVQYNFQVIAIASRRRKGNLINRAGLPPKTCRSYSSGASWASSRWVTPAIYRAEPRAVSHSYCIAAAGAGSAAASWGSPAAIYGTVVAFRLVIGYGLGGVSSECDEGRGERRRRRQQSIGRTAWAFFWQGPGMCAPYVVAIILRACLASDAQALQWRLLLGLGAAPALLAMAFLREDAQEDQGRDAAEAARAAKAQIQRDAKTKIFWRRFAGCGGAWFLYDVALYGTTLLGPSSRMLRGKIVYRTRPGSSSWVCPSTSPPCC